jgi:hypothetical protein
MNTTGFSIACIVFMVSFTQAWSQKEPLPETFTGVYDGLTEYLEFQFTSDNEKVYIFEAIDGQHEYDLFDEKWVDHRFKITWTAKKVEVFNTKNEPTGEKREIKIILKISKL